MSERLYRCMKWDEEALTDPTEATVAGLDLAVQCSVNFNFIQYNQSSCGGRRQGLICFSFF